MQIWCDVYSASNPDNRMGDGPVLLSSASFTRLLDGAGQFTIGIVASDPRALALVQNERRVRVFVEDQDVIRELGRGIIRDIKLSAGTSLSRSVTGVDALDELKRRNTLIGRKYKQKTLGLIVQRLIDLVPGWTVSVNSGIAGQLMDARFDGASVLKAFQDIAKNRGVHFRLGTATNVVEFGDFGQLRTDVYALNAEGGIADPSPNALIIEKVDIIDSSEDVVNWIVPIGGGEGEAAALTLQRSTRTSPYTIQSTVLGKKTIYYLQDSTSVSQYGQIEKVLKFTDIAPLSNAKQDIIDAANVLYDAAVAELQRTRNPQRTYRLQCTNVKKTVRPGDKINVRYKGIIYRDGQEIAYADFNEDLYVVKVTEKVDLGGISLTLEVSTQDRLPQDEADRVIKSMETVELQGLKPIISVAPANHSFVRDLYNRVPESCAFEITDAVLDVQRVYVRLRTDKARVHSHQMFTNRFSAAQPGSGDYSLVGVSRRDVGANEVTAAQIVMAINELGGADDLPIHTERDEAYPTSDFSPLRIRVSVNGVDRTEELGGPFPNSTTPGETIDITLDVDKMTDYIKNDPGGLQQRHTITLEARRDYGRVELTVEMFQVVQAIVLDDDYQE